MAHVNRVWFWFGFNFIQMPNHSDLNRVDTCWVFNFPMIFIAIHTLGCKQWYQISALIYNKDWLYPRPSRTVHWNLSNQASNVVGYTCELSCYLIQDKRCLWCRPYRKSDWSMCEEKLRPTFKASPLSYHYGKHAKYKMLKQYSFITGIFVYNESIPLQLFPNYDMMDACFSLHHCIPLSHKHNLGFFPFSSYNSQKQLHP